MHEMLPDTELWHLKPGWIAAIPRLHHQIFGNMFLIKLSDADPYLDSVPKTHFFQVGEGSLLSHTSISVDRPTSAVEGQREKRGVMIGARAVIGYGSHLEPGTSVGDVAVVSDVSP